LPRTLRSPLATPNAKALNGTIAASHWHELAPAVAVAVAHERNTIGTHPIGELGMRKLFEPPLTVEHLDAGCHGYTPQAPVSLRGGLKAYVHGTSEDRGPMGDEL
jgi:hypothetical protein